MINWKIGNCVGIGIGGTFSTHGTFANQQKSESGYYAILQNMFRVILTLKNLFPDCPYKNLRRQMTLQCVDICPRRFILCIIRRILVSTKTDLHCISVTVKQVMCIKSPKNIGVLRVLHELK
jgi:hypothetical protein